MMNNPPWHVLWKEYRAIRGFWISLLLLALLVQGMLYLTTLPGMERGTVLFSTALAAAALFVVGCMAALFAGERDEATHKLLQILPTSGMAIAGGKLAFAAISTFALAAVLIGTGYLLFGVSVTRYTLGNVLAIYGVAVLECAAWAALISLVSRRPLVTAVTAIALASLTAHLADLQWRAGVETRVWTTDMYAEAWPYRLAMTLIVAVLAVWVARGWLSTQRGSFASSMQSMLPIWQNRDSTAQPFCNPPSLPIVGRLLWQSWRQSQRVAVAFALLSAPIAAALVKVLSMASGTSPIPQWIVISSVVGAVIGSMTFQADQQQRQYRFFAERAEQPGLVWFSRLVVWGSVCMSAIAIGHLLMGWWLTAEDIRKASHAAFQVGGASEMDSSSMRSHATTVAQSTYAIFGSVVVVAFSAVITFGGFCVGQFSSILFRSGVVAGFVAVVATLLFAGCAAAMWAWGLWWWSFAIVFSLALPLATRLRTRSWILERRTAQAWLAPSFVVMLPLVITAISVVLARTDIRVAHFPGANEVAGKVAVYEEDLQELRDDSTQAADDYLKACDQLSSWWSVREEAGLEPDNFDWDDPPQVIELRASWIDSNGQSIDTAIAASETGPTVLPMQAVERDRRRSQLLSLQNALLDSSVLLARQGEHLAGLARLKHALKMTADFRRGQITESCLYFKYQPVYDAVARWARADGQTVELLRQAINEVDTHSPNTPPLVDNALADHVRLREYIDGERYPNVAQNNIASALPVLANMLPWERQRALAILSVVTAGRVSALQVLDNTLKNDRQLRFVIAGWHSNNSQLLRPNMLGAWLRTTHLLRDLYRKVPQTEYLAKSVTTDELRRQALLLELGLLTYRAEHGEYPLTLDELVDGPLSVVPLDPLANATRESDPTFTEQARWFLYHPRGLDGWLDARLAGQRTLIPPGTPFFWSMGESRDETTLRRVSEQSIGYIRPNSTDESPWPDLEGHPLYRIVSPGFTVGPQVFVLPRPDNASAETGRSPDEDGIPFVREWYYGDAGGGYAGASGYAGAGGGYAGAAGYEGGYQSGESDSSDQELEGQPPGNDLPPIE